MKKISPRKRTTKKQRIKRNIKKRKTRKIRRNKYGGFLFDQNLNIGGIDFARETGKKRYNWTTGKWDDYVCYGVGPFKGCKIVPAK